MATFYRCDRCSRETTDRGDMYLVEIPFYREWTTGDKDSRNIDLCSICIKELNKFINPLPKESK